MSVNLVNQTSGAITPVAGCAGDVINGIINSANNNGCKNLCPNSRILATVGGVTYTPQSDGSFVVTGATSASSPSYSDVKDSFILPAGTYIFSSPNTPIESNIELVLDDITSGSPVRVTTLYNSTSEVFTLNSDTKLCCYMWINKNVTLPVGGIHFYPMIRLATDTDGTYEPYAMSNQQLTDKLKFRNSSSFADAYDKALLFVNIGVVFTISGISHAVTQLIPKGLVTGNLRFVMGGGDVYCQIQIDTSVNPPTITNAYASYKGSQITIDQIVYTYV